MLASKLRATAPLLAVMLCGFAATAASADTVPLPAGTAGTYSLASTSCPAAGDCVAVGTFADTAGSNEALIETESNGNWASIVPDLSQLPNVYATPNAQLTAVSCSSIGNCVAVGSYYDTNGPEGLIETETNGTWSAAGLNLSSLPNVGGNPYVTLNSVSCPSNGNCSAVGDYNDGYGEQQGLLADDTNGAWTASEADVSSLGGTGDPYTTLTQVSCAAAGVCSAVGDYTDTAGDTLALIESEYGGVWSGLSPDMSQLPSVAGTGTQDALLQSVSCPSVGNCTAVGSYVDGGANGGSLQGMLVGESDGAWSPASEAWLPADAYTAGSPGIPAEGDLVLESVSCASAGNCTAVGSYDATSANNVEALELTEIGGNWGAGAAASLPSGVAANPEATLDSVSCTAPGTCVAAGTDEFSDGNNGTLLVRQSTGAWSSSSTEQQSNYSYFRSNAATVACAANGYCADAGYTQDSTQNLTPFLLDPPGAVQSLRAVASGRTAAVISWNTPSRDQSDPSVSGYTVTVHDLTSPSLGGRTISAGSRTGVTVTGLTADDTYTFTVSSDSILGTGLTATSGTVALGLTNRQISASLAELLVPKGAASRLRELHRTHGYTFRYTPLESGKVSVRWYETTGDGKHRHTHLVASGSAIAGGTRTVHLRVRLTAFGRSAVRSAHSLRLSATAEFTSGRTVTRTRVFTLH